MIKLTGLSKAYHGNQVLNGIDLEVKKGEIVVIIGPSGTGKSTLLRCLNLLETPDAGTLAIDDLELNLAKASEQQAIELRKRASFVFQKLRPFCQQNSARQHRRRADHRLEAAKSGGPCHSARHPQGHWSCRQAGCLSGLPLRRPAAAGRHWPRHGGPLQGDPV